MLLKSFLRHRCLSLALAVVVSAAAWAPAPAAGADEAMATAQAAYEAGDHARALEIWLLEAYEGNPEAQYRLGRMFADGTGTVADAAEAVYWYTRAAEQGHATAQYELGSASFHGLGTKPDKEAALTWWRVAAENGSADAQYQLGRAYFYGIDIAQDAALAIEYLGDAADNGHRLAREFLDRVGGSAAGAENGSEGADWAGYGRVASRPIWVYGSYNRFSPIITRLEPGSLVRVVERQGGWFRAQVPGGLPVWVAAAQLAEDGAGHSVDGPGVAARPDPGNDPGTRPLGMFTEGDNVRLLERRGDWARVQAPETISGWVEAVDIVEIDDAGEQIARAWREAARSTVLDESIAGRPTVVLPSAGRTEEEDAAGAGVSAQPVVAADDSTGQAVALDDSEVDTDARADAAEEDSPVGAETQDESGKPAELAAAADTLSSDAGGAAEPSATVGTPPAVVALDEVAEGDYLRVGEGGTPVHALDSVDSARIDVLAEGTLVRVVQRRGEWARVEVPGGLPLWIFSRFIDIDGDVGRITGRGVRARPLPSTSGESQPIGVYPEGVEVSVVSESGSWVRIRAPESLAAWLPIEGMLAVDDDADAVALQWSVQAEGVAAGSEPESAPSGGDLADAASPAGEGGSDASRATEDAVGTAAEQVPTESAEPLPRQPEIIAASTEPQEVMAATGDDADAEPAEAPAADEIVAAIESAEPEPAVVDIESALRDAAHVQSTDVVEGDAAPDVAVPAAGDSGEALAMTGTEPAANNGEVDVPDATEASEITWSTGPAEAPEAAETAATRASDASETPRPAEAVDGGEVPEGDQTAEVGVTAAGEVIEGSETTGIVEAPQAAEIAGPTAPESVESVESVEAPGAAETVETSEGTYGPGAAGTTAVSAPEAGGVTQSAEIAEAAEAVKIAGSAEAPEAADVTETADTAETGASEAGAITEAAESVEAIAAIAVPGPTEIAEVAEPETGEVTDVVETVETVEPPEAAEPPEDTAAEAGETVEPTETAEAAPIAQAVETAAAEASAAGPRLDDLGWLYSQSPDAFSIEVTRDAALDEVSRAAAGLSSGTASYAFSSRNGSGLVYNLMVGSFADLIEVQQALGALPSAFENIRIRRLGAVQQEWCGQLDNLTPEQLMLVVDKCARQATAAQ